MALRVFWKSGWVCPDAQKAGNGRCGCWFGGGGVTVWMGRVVALLMWWCGSMLGCMVE